MLRAALAAHGEFEIVALAHAAELVDFIMVPGDERAHLTARHLQAVVGCVEVGPNARDVAAQLGHIFRVGFARQLLIHIIAERSKLLVISYYG